MRINLQYKVWCCFFLSRAHSPLLQWTSAITVISDKMLIYTATYSMWSHSLCVVHSLCCSSVFKDTEIDEKEFWSRLNGEVNLLQAILVPLADPGGSGSHRTKPLWRGLAVFRKGIGFPHPLPPLPSYPRNKRKRGVVHFPEPWHLALSDEQRQQYISTLLEKNKSLYKALHFTENHLPQTQRNPTL